MKKRSPHPAAVVEEPSPQSWCRESIGQWSIDFARSSFGSTHDDLDVENEAVPNLAVIEELESIRGMIETKSKDLQMREASLSRSVSKWNSEIVTAQGLVEALAGNLLDVGEKRLTDLFESYVARLKRLISQLNDRLKKQESFAQKLNRPRGHADVPPLPLSEVSCSPILASILAWISENPSSLHRRVACASVLICGGRSVSEKECKFVTNCIYNALLSVVRSKLHSSFIQAIDSGLICVSDSNEVTKFTKAKRSILKKQLGLPEGTSCSLEVYISGESTGDSKLVDVCAELDDHLKQEWESAKASFLFQNRDHLIRVWSDPSAQSCVLASLRLKSTRKGLKYSIVQMLLGPVEERSMADSIRELSRVLNESPKKYLPLLDGLLSCLVYVLHTALQDSKAIIDQYKSFFDQLYANKVVADHFGRILSKNPQLLWFLFQKVFIPDRISLPLCLLEIFKSILEKADDLEPLRAWKSKAVDAIQNKRVAEDTVPFLKTLLKRF